MFAEPWQVHHEGVFELTVDILLNIVEIVVLTAIGKFAAEDFFPVRSPDDLVHALAGNQTARASGRVAFISGADWR